MSPELRDNLAFLALVVGLAAVCAVVALLVYAALVLLVVGP